MNTILNLLLLSVIICFIIDLSGFTFSIKKIIADKLKPYFSFITPETIKLPFISCSLCTIWWCGLIYLLIVKDFTLFNIFILSLFSYFSSNLAGILSWIKELFTTIENKLYNLLKF